MRMSYVSMLTGAILVVVGVVSYVVSQSSSVTALIPSFIGAVFVVLGLLALRENLTKHVMHAAAVLSLLAILGSVDGVLPFFQLLGGATVDRPAAAVAKVIMLLTCIVFLALAVRSFIEARRARQQTSAA
ncbi:MAG: hypothetical protein AAF708_07340 [Deinococcota bacterium]